MQFCNGLTQERSKNMSEIMVVPRGISPEAYKIMQKHIPNYDEQEQKPTHQDNEKDKAEG